MSQVKLPIHGSFYEWFTDLSRSYPTLKVPSATRNQKDWHRWAMMLISINRGILGHIVLPLKAQFTDEESWRRWAFFFIQDTANI